MLLNKSLERTRDMFIDSNPYVPRPFEPRYTDNLPALNFCSRLRKMKTKLKEGYLLPQLKFQLASEKEAGWMFC
jgi:hypothetical protein